MDKQTLFELIDKYVEGTANPHERTLLDEYADQLASMGDISLPADEKARLKEEMHRNILMHVGMPPQSRIIPMYRRVSFRIAAAVVIFIMIGLGLFAYFKNRNLQQQVARSAPAKQMSHPVATALFLHSQTARRLCSITHRMERSRRLQ